MSSSSILSLHVIIMALVIFPTPIYSQNLKSLISLQELLSTNPPTSTSGNVNIISSSTGESLLLALAYLPFLFFFSTGDGIPLNILGSYESFAAASLAMEHLNTGDGSIVPELTDIHKRCPLRFTSKAFDTEASQRVGVDHIISITDRSKTDQLLPCGILGAAYSSISVPTSIISGLRGFPQISPISTSSSLDDKSQYKLFGRTVPNDDGTAIPLLAKLQEWNVNYLAVLHVDDAYGNAFAKGINIAAQQVPNLQVETIDISYAPSEDEISEAINKLKNTQYTYFFGILFSEDIDRIMTEAFNQGIAGDGIHQWLYSDGLGSYIGSKQFEVGSPLAKAFRGTGVLSAVGGIPGIESYDKLVSSLQQLNNDDDVAYLESLLPSDYIDGKVVNHTVVTRGTDFLSTPGLVAPFLYDAVVLMGLAACQLVEQSNGTKDDYFTGEELYDALLSNLTSFEGTSGRVVLDSTTGTRDPRSALYSLTNFIDDGDASDDDMVQFKAIGTDVFKFGQWESLAPYTFNDGTQNVALDLPALETNSNYLSTGLRVVGLLLCCAVFVMSAAFTYWTYANRCERVVKSSQPIFLYLLTGGIVILASAIIPLTVDLGIASQEGANAACMSYPWLLALGFSLTFSALFTKTYRIVKIMENARRFKRIKLTASDVMKPMVVLLLINIIILLVWSIIDPITHETIVVEQDPFDRSTNTYGVCSSEHQTIFICLLGVINLGILLFAVLQAYRARNISTELQESSYIFQAMALCLLVSFIGIPVIIIARENVSAYYFVSAGLIFVICSSILLLIFVPKIKALRDKRLRRSDSRNSTARSSITSSSEADDEGIRIINSAQGQAELKKEVADLKLLLVKAEQNGKSSGTTKRRSSVVFEDEINISQANCEEEEDDDSDSYASFERFMKCSDVAEEK